MDVSIVIIKPRSYEIPPILNISLLAKTPLEEILTKCDFKGIKEHKNPVNIRLVLIAQRYNLTQM